MDIVFIIISLLFIKHWYVDFVNQTSDEVAHKGIYGHWIGIKHSLKQGAATFISLLVFVDVFVSLMLGMLDFVIHYHVDFIKMRFGNRDITTPAFWAHLGLDQLAHALTYLLIVWLLF